MARLRAAEGDLDGALELLDEADRVYAGDYSPNVQPVPAVRARLRLRRGELDARARQWARERQLSADDEPSYLREYEHLTLARLLIAQHRVDPDAGALANALGLLDRLLAPPRAAAAARASSRSWSCRRSRTTPAATCRPRSTRCTAPSRSPQPEGYVRLFADEGPPMAALLKALASSRPPRPTSADCSRRPPTTGTRAGRQSAADRAAERARARRAAAARRRPRRAGHRPRSCPSR